MSSTNRGTRGGDGFDDFASPRWTIHRLLEKCHLPGGLWYEPCAGAGNIIRAVNEGRSDVRWIACEVQRKYTNALAELPIFAFVIDDCMEAMQRFPSDDEPTVTITNPPFAISEEILRALLKYLPNTLPVFQQRTGWLESTRAPLFRELKPSFYALPDRPSYRDSVSVDPKTGKLKKSSNDSATMGWWVFDGRAHFEVLDNTPKSVIKAEKAERRAAEKLTLAPSEATT